jgi:hypothetical protein
MCVSLIESEAYVFALFVLCLCFAASDIQYFCFSFISVSLRMLPAPQTLSWPQIERVSAFVRNTFFLFVSTVVNKRISPATVGLRSDVLGKKGFHIFHRG